MGIHLPAGLARLLLAHARRELPNESCALLGGDQVDGRVTSVHLARNRLASPYRYDVEPHDLSRILHDIERGGEALVAIFHSHPSSAAVPSMTDIREAAYPVIQLVASLQRDAPTLRGWKIEGPRSFEVGVSIVDPG